MVTYRNRLQLIRDVVGPKTFLEGCPAGTLLDGIGFFNSYFNGADVYNTWLGSYSSIGIILLQIKNNTVVEFAIKSFDKAMGVATYKTSKQTPVEMKGILPDADELGKLLE